VINKEAIRVLPIFEFMAHYVDEEEMYRTFNMGVGMIWVVENEHLEAVCQNTGGYPIGHLETGKKGVEWA